MTLALTKRVVGAFIGLMVGTLLSLAAPLTYAQTSSTTDTTSGAVTTPGAPATGVGGDPAGTYLSLGASALVLLAGAAYLARTKRQEA
jgi:hypothetical protein